MLSESFPPPARFAAAGVCLGLAWWAFGRKGAATRRPWVVWAAGFAAAWLVLAGEGFVFLFSRGARWWLPTVAVGIAGSWFVLRATRGTTFGRRLAAGAVLLMIASPFLSRASAVLESRYDLTGRLSGWTGLSIWELNDVVGEGLGGVAMFLTAALIAVAVWRPPTPPVPDDARTDG